MLLKGDCLVTLKSLPDNSIDAVVTDPPYELGFMGKAWDNSGIAYNVKVWKECFRVLKPGGHLLAFSGSRTYHRMTVAIEDAGFEIRDQIMWLYGSGFPKSLDVSKAIDKAAGAEREVVGQNRYAARRPSEAANSPVGFSDSMGGSATANITAPVTPEAQRWQGWGTALKPAHEPICVARKPLTGTVASNVLEWGTGALNIDGSRVGTETVVTTNGKGFNGLFEGGTNNNGGAEREGRWPANVIHDGSDEVLSGFPNDAGRFFYCAKASKSERNAGLEGLPERRQDEDDYERAGTTNPRNRSQALRQNFHPTVKPLALMRYLVKLVTPPNGTVLDPFLGSGSTAVACILEGFDWVGCEMTEDYWPIIEARVAWAHQQQVEPKQEKLF